MTLSLAARLSTKRTPTKALNASSKGYENVSPLRLDTRLQEDAGHARLGYKLSTFIEMARAGQWTEMGHHVTDEMLDQYAIVGKPDEVVKKIGERFGNLAVASNWMMSGLTDYPMRIFGVL